jgi:multicomponent Na+:H+ antiporter subunit E
LSRTLTTALMLIAAWLLWSGHAEPLLLGLGLVSVLTVLAITRRMDRFSESEGDEYPGLGLLLYLPWLVWQMFKSNLDVARIILNPRLPISPRLIRVPANQKTETGQAIYANSITLTPGTISLDVRDNQILVHALTEESAAGVEEGEMDRRVCRTEGAH